MRPRIEALDVDAMDWQPLGPAGLYSKLLSRDPETGARTALQRLCPSDAYEPPRVAHFHMTYEEILGVSGEFSFDSRLWIRPGSYVFHPPMTVHGFKSGIREESTFLSRVGRDLDFNFVPDPKAQDLYVVDGSEPVRRPVAHGDAMGSLGWRDASFLGAPVQACVLSTDPQSGEGSAFIRLQPGWASATVKLDHYLEIFVLQGGLSVAGGTAGPAHSYSFYPPAASISPLRAEVETIAYVNFGGPIGL